MPARVAQWPRSHGIGHKTVGVGRSRGPSQPGNFTGYTAVDRGRGACLPEPSALPLPKVPAKPTTTRAMTAKGGPDDERDEQPLDLVAGERYQGVWCGIAVVFVRADDGEEGGRERGQGDPAGPERRRTWCSSKTARPLPDWKNSSTRHLDPATRTRVVSGTAAAGE